MYCKKIGYCGPQRARIQLQFQSGSVHFSVWLHTHTLQVRTMMNCNCPTFNLCNMTKIWCISHTHTHSRDWIKFTVNKFWIRSNFVCVCQCLVSDDASTPNYIDCFSFEFGVWKIFRVSHFDLFLNYYLCHKIMLVSPIFQYLITKCI